MVVGWGVLGNWMVGGWIWVRSWEVERFVFKGWGGLLGGGDGGGRVGVWVV